MTARARYRKIEIAHYRATVHAVVGRDLAAAYALARRRCPALTDAHDPADEAACLTGPDGAAWVLFPARASPGLVAHEAVHAAVLVARRRGLPVSASADEVLAYLVEEIVSKVAEVVDDFA